MKPLVHASESAFLLAEISGELLRMRSCEFDAQAAGKQSAAGSTSESGMATAFRLLHTQGEESAAVTLHWKKSQGEWRVVSYSVVVD